MHCTDHACIHRISAFSDRHLTVPVRDNLSYVPTPSRSTASQPPSKTGRAPTQGEAASANNYSSFGPTYETVDSGCPRQPGRSQVPLRERYEFTEIHAETDSDVPDVVGANYEVPVNLGQSAVHEEYSHLQY